MRSTKFYSGRLITFTQLKFISAYLFFLFFWENLTSVVYKSKEEKLSMISKIRVFKLFNQRAKAVTIKFNIDFNFAKTKSQITS